MAIVQLRLPEMTNTVVYANAYLRSRTGIINVPRFAVPELLAAGCQLIDPMPEKIDVADELRQADDYEINFYLHSHGVPPSETMRLELEQARERALAMAHDQGRN